MGNKDKGRGTKTWGGEQRPRVGNPEFFMGNNYTSPKLIPVCPACMDGKQTRDPFPLTASHCSVPLELVHSDLHGPLLATANGYKYWISFTDDASCYQRCWLLHKKSEAFSAFKQYNAWVEKQTGKALKALRDDKGGEYMSNEWEHGIERQHTTRATPQQNGVAECTNRILDEGVASLLSDLHFPACFWGEALSCYLHTLNRSPSTAVAGKTPFESFYGRKPSVSHLPVFGCRAYTHVLKDKHSSFAPKSRKCIFLGYPVNYKGWKCWDPITGDLFISCDVCFVETEMPGAELDLPGPFYEPLSGSVGESAGPSPAPASSSPSVPSVEPGNSNSDDADSDSGSELDPNDPPFVPGSNSDDSDSDNNAHPFFALSPSASPPASPVPQPSPDPEPSASPEPELSPSPEAPLDSRDSRMPPAANQPYVTHSGCPSHPVGEWWKNHPYKHAQEQHRRTRCSGSTPELAAEAQIVALEEANSLRTLSDSELIEYAFLMSGTEPESYKEAMT
jgi:hypothetical protein